MSHSSSEGSDAYRESFKYFKKFSLSSLQTYSNPLNKINCNRTNGNNNRPEDEGEITQGSFDKYSTKEKRDEALNDVVLPYPLREVAGQVIKREIILKDDHCECFKMWGLRSPEKWDVVELTFPKGLIVIKNPFTSAGQRYWISRALLDFPHHPKFITNMDNLNRLEKMKRKGSVEQISDFKLDTSSRDFYKKLRWVTFGYHHDWDTKIYSEKMKSQFPEDLADMSRYISHILNFPNDFEAEAAIANYYHMDSTLSGHIDKSEVNQAAPLFSLSFGQSAIFLIGGRAKNDVPQPVVLKSGDIAIMSGESRMSYHGVPKILPALNEPWSLKYQSNDYDKDRDCVLRHLDLRDESCKRLKLDDSSSEHVTLHDCISLKSTLKDVNVSSKIQSTKWTDFNENYIKKSRINLNVRQVLFNGQTSLT